MTSYQRRRNELNIKGAEQHMNNSGLGTQPTPFSKKAMIKIRPNGFFFFWEGGLVRIGKQYYIEKHSCNLKHRPGVVL